MTLKCYNEDGTHKKHKIAHPQVFSGAASAYFFLAQSIRAQENSISPPPRLCQVVNRGPGLTGKLPKHYASASAKLRGVFDTWDLPLLN